jgi:hypothetical protein
MSTVKEELVKLVHSLPEDCTDDDLLYQLYVRRKVRLGIDAIERGEGKTIDEAKQLVDTWFTSSGPTPR